MRPRKPFEPRAAVGTLNKIYALASELYSDAPTYDSRAKDVAMQNSLGRFAIDLQRTAPRLVDEIHEAYPESVRELAGKQ